jgi:hypothetical protein
MAYDGSAVVSPASRVAIVRASNRAIAPVPATAPIVRRLVVVASHGSDARTPLIAVDVDTLQGYEIDDFDGLGFSLGKAIKNVGKTVVKAVKDTGHVTGKVVTSTAGKAIIGGALALTGVGIPAAAAIGAATQGVGTIIKPGGNIGQAAKATVTGAAGGVAASVAGKGIKKFAPNVTTTARKVFNKVTPGDTFKTDATGAAINTRRRTSVIPATLPADGPPDRRPGWVRDSAGKWTRPSDVAPPLPPGPPVMVVPPPPSEIAVETAKQGTGIVKRARSAMQRAKGASNNNGEILAAIERLAQNQPSTVQTYTPPSAPAPSESPTPDKPANGIGGIPPVALAAGVVGLLFLMNRR